MAQTVPKTANLDVRGIACAEKMAIGPLECKNVRAVGQESGHDAGL